MSLPNTNCAGDMSTGFRGVFLNIMSPATMLCLSITPAGEMFARISFFASFTASSATPLDLDMYGEDVMCSMPHFLQKSANSDLNWGPPSE